VKEGLLDTAAVTEFLTSARYGELLHIDHVFSIEDDDTLGAGGPCQRLSARRSRM
jgi:hypothetical protein